jgi:DNA polymerase phi
MRTTPRWTRRRLRRSRLRSSRLVRSRRNEDDESDSDSDPADGMDDEAMFGIDKLLGRAFKSQREDINRKKNLVRATRDFKFRVLSLLELYAKCQPASPYLPGAALPLLGAMQDALVAGTPQSAALAERIGGVLTKSVCHAKDLPTGAGAEPVDAESIAGELKLAIRAAAKPAGAGGDAKGFAKPATAVAMYLLRVLEAVSRMEKKSGEDEASPDAVRCLPRRARGVQDQQAVPHQGSFLPVRV